MYADDTDRPHHRGLLLLSITLMVLVYFLDNLSIALANRYVYGGLGIDQRSYSLATACYSAAVILTSAPHQWFAQRLGYRNLIFAAVGVHLVGQVFCLIATDLPIFIAGRMLMGAGAATFFAGARVLVQMYFSGPQLPTGIRAFASGVPLGGALASFTTAELLEGHQWRAIFMVPALACLLVAVCVWLSLPRRSHPLQNSGAPSLLSMVLLAAGSLLLTTTTQRLAFDFFSDGLRLALELLLGVAILGLYVYYERGLARPTLDFKHAITPGFLAGMLFMMLNYFLLGAYNFVIPQYVVNGLQLPVHTAGGVMALGWLCGLVPLLMITSVWLRERFPWGGFRKYLVAGYLLLAGYGFWMARQHADVPLYQQLVPGLMMHGTYLISTFAVIIMYTFMRVEPAYFSQAFQIKNMTQQLVMPLGIVLSNVFLQWRDAFHATVLSAAITPYAQTYQAYGERYRLATGADNALAQIASLVTRQSQVLGYLDYFWLVAWIGLALALYMAVQRHFR